MQPHPLPPFDAWLWLRAWQETWLATLDPAGAGKRLRAQRLQQLIETALRDSPLYARRSPGARVLADFEPVGKTELMQHFDDWVTDRRITRSGVDALLGAGQGVANAWLGRYLVWTSSGTTGEPGIFVQDAASLAAYDAIDALRLRVGPGPPGTTPALGLWGLGRRFAYVGAIGGPYAGHVTVARLQRIVPALLAPQVHLLSVLDPLALVARRLQALQPDVLITYPSCAVALAERQARGTLQLHLSELWLGGEQLSAAQRDALRAAFGCTLRNSYGASEFYSIAFECGQGQLHVNDDWVILEGIDARQRPVPVGTFSHTTLLTNLANLTQPLLRYRLTDRVRFVAARCGCGSGFPVIEVEGRSDDALVLPARRGGSVTLLPLALETVIEEEAGITRFQLLRHADDAIEVRLPLQGSHRRVAFDRCRLALLAYFERQGLAPPRVVFGRHAPVHQRGSGKLRRVIDLQARH